MASPAELSFSKVQSNGSGSLDLVQVAKHLQQQQSNGEHPFWPRSRQPGCKTTSNGGTAIGGIETSTASANTSLTDEIFANVLDKACEVSSVNLTSFTAASYQQQESSMIAPDDQQYHQSSFSFQSGQ